MFDTLLRLTWLVEEKPVVTRFFLFTPCCFALFRMKLLSMPSCLFTAGVLAKESDSPERIAAVKAFYEQILGDDARLSLNRRAILIAAQNGFPESYQSLLLAVDKAAVDAERPSWRGIQRSCGHNK